MITLPILPTLKHFSFEGWENVFFELGSERVDRQQRRTSIRIFLFTSCEQVQFYEGTFSPIPGDGGDCLECSRRKRKRAASWGLWNFLLARRSRRSVLTPAVDSSESALRASLAWHRRRERDVDLLPPVGMQVRRTNGTQMSITGLEPYTSYVFQVRGYNSGGYGPTSAIPVTTVDKSKSR